MNRIRRIVLFTMLLMCVVSARPETEELSADSLMALSMQCYDEDRLVEALDYATQTLRQSKVENNSKIYIDGLAYVARIYGVFKDYDKAHHYFLLCLEQAKATGDRDMVARCYSNLTMTSCMLGHVDEAKHYLALQGEAREAGSVRQQFFFLSNQGKVAATEKQWRQAIYFAKQARDYAATHEMGLMFEASEAGEMASAYEQLGDDSMAVTLYRDMLGMALEVGDQKGASRAYECLASINLRLGNHQQAAIYRERSVQLADSVFNTRDFNSAKGRLAAFEEEQNAEQLSVLGRRINNQLWIIALFVVLLALVAIMALILMRRNRSLQAAYQLLVEKNKEAIRQNEGEHLPAEQHRQLLAAIDQVMRSDDIVCSPDFDLARLCTLVGANAKYVSWVINDHHHISFKALLNKYRIQIASKRLVDEENYGHLTIQAVAESVGYKSQTNFIQVFKSIVGMTPSTYQKISRSIGGVEESGS